MASAAGRLWGVTGDNRLCSRHPLEADVAWELEGAGPAAGTRALAGTPFLLYAVDTDGELWMAPAHSPVTWQLVPSMATREPSIRCMAAYQDILFAATNDFRLLRTQPDFVYECTAWVEVHHCNYATALAVVDTMLFVTTTQNRLWWLDVHSIAAP